MGAFSVSDDNVSIGNIYKSQQECKRDFEAEIISATKRMETSEALLESLIAYERNGYINHDAPVSYANIVGKLFLEQRNLRDLITRLIGEQAAEK